MSMEKNAITSVCIDMKASGSWHDDLLDSYRSVRQLLEYLGLDAQNAPYLVCTDPVFPMAVTRSFTRRMEKKNWFDPLLLQVLPQSSELIDKEGFTRDAVDDVAATSVPGLLQKYHGRALMLSSSTCATNCRFCLRRHFTFASRSNAQQQQDAAWEYLAEHTDVRELILSGGDPLMPDNHALSATADCACALPHLRILRIHTRIPVTLPSRIDAGLLDFIRHIGSSKTVIVVIHANHANELQDDCAEALTALRQTGAMMLHQMVLLKGVNDSVPVLQGLMTRLIELGVTPYYIHQLDRVAGTAHFEVSEAVGRSLIGELRRVLPGYAIPRYVREIAGADSKVPL